MMYKLISCDVYDQAIYNQPGVAPSILRIITVICAVYIGDWAYPIINQILSQHIACMPALSGGELSKKLASS